MTGRWEEIGDQVYARRYAELELTVGLVVGDDRCLVIDTRGDAEQGAELARAVREITDLPWLVAITHSHFDHCFGTSAFVPADVWAQQNCRAELLASGADTRTRWAAKYRSEDKPEIADAIAATEIEIPNQLVTKRAEVDVGDRLVVLQHFGRGHSSDDLIVHVTDGDVVFAGDLVENSGDPAFGPDADPFGWPSSLDGLLGTGAQTYVPGHGDPVDLEYVVEQRKDLADLAELCRAAVSDGLADDDVLRRSPFTADTTRDALAAARLVVQRRDGLPGW